MKHLKEKYDESIYSSALMDFYFRDMNIGILDIETTGLDPSRNKFILGGLFNTRDKTMHQVFAESRSEEAAALERFTRELEGLDMVVTYNGRHFDMPFINKRLKSFGMKSCRPYNLDLYLVVSGHSPIRKFVPNLKQKTVENYMGLWQSRADEISGAESVELYNRYEKTGDPGLEEKILLHNSDDVLQLARLLRVISKTDFHKAMHHLGFPAGPLTVDKIRFEGNFMTVSGLQRNAALDYRGFFLDDYPVETCFVSRDSYFDIRFPLIRDSGLAIVDLEAAGLPQEDFAKYPSYSSGFLVVEDHSSRNYMEINHFIIAFIKRFMESI